MLVRREYMIPEIRLLAAKASKENDNLWLPLLDHLKDTAGVIEYLASRWLPGSVYDEMEISRKEGIRLAKLLALLHDIGKGFRHSDKNIGTASRHQVFSRIGRN